MALPDSPPSKPEPEVVRVLRNYRTAIDGKDEIMTRQLADHWLRIESQLQAEIAWMAQEIADAQAAGDPITEQLIMRSERYKRLQRQVQAEVAKYNQEAAAIISQTQETMIALGIDAAQAAIITQTSPFFAFNRINVGAVQNMIGMAGDGSPLLALLQNSYGDASAGILNAMIDGIAHGFGAAQIAQNMTGGMAMGLERALLIARTETMRAYREASLQQYRDSGVVGGFYRLVKKSTACVACLMMDGDEYALESQFSDHPRGKCQVLAKINGVGKPKWEKGKDWFEKLPEDEQRRRMGGDKYEAWKRGEFDLKDLAKMDHSDVWGDSPRVATLEELTGKKKKPAAGLQIKKPEPIKFTDAKSINEANDYARNTLGLKYADYKGADLQIANEWNKGLAESFDRMPDLKKHISGTGTTQSVYKAQYDYWVKQKQAYYSQFSFYTPERIKQLSEQAARKLAVRTPANIYAYSMSGDRTGFGLDGVFFTNKMKPDNIMNYLQADLLTRFHPEGTATIKAILDHEVGHKIDDMLKVHSDSRISDLFVNLLRSGDMKDQLSSYAMNGKGEFIAEAWSEFTNNPNPRPVATQVGNIIMELYESRKNK